MVSCLECPLGKNCRIYILQLIQKQVYMTWSFWHRLKCGEVKWEVLFPQLHPVTCLIQIHEQLNYSWSAEVHRCSWELVTHNIKFSCFFPVLGVTNRVCWLQFGTETPQTNPIQIFLDANLVQSSGISLGVTLERIPVLEIFHGIPESSFHLLPTKMFGYAFQNIIYLEGCQL